MLEIGLYCMGLGAIAGLLAGLFGIGGGLVIVPVLVLLFKAYGFAAQPMMLMALATSLATILVTSLSAVWAHQRLGAVNWPVVFRLAPAIMLGTVLGACLAKQLPANGLRILCGVYMLLVAGQLAFKVTPIITGLRQPRWLDSLVGQIIGIVSALVGIGGGTLSVPYLLSCGHSMPKAVAISSACGFPIAFAGTVSYALLGWQQTGLPPGSLGYVYLPAFLGITSLSAITAPLGAKLAHHLPASQLKQAFSILLLAMACKLLWP